MGKRGGKLPGRIRLSKLENSCSYLILMEPQHRVPGIQNYYKSMKRISSEKFRKLLLQSSRLCTVLYCTVLCSTLQYRTVQFSTTQHIVMSPATIMFCLDLKT